MATARTEINGANDSLVSCDANTDLPTSKARSRSVALVEDGLRYRGRADPRHLSKMHVKREPICKVR